MLSSRRNNWLAAVVVEPAQGKQPLRWGLASADAVSTGEVQVMQREESSALHQQLAQQEASELLWATALDAERPTWCPERLRPAPMASTPFSPVEAERTLQQHYGLSSLDGLGLRNIPWPCRHSAGCCVTCRTPTLEEDSLLLWKCQHREPRRCPGAGCPDPPQPRFTPQRDNQFQGSGPSIAPSPPWAAVACVAGWKHR